MKSQSVTIELKVTEQYFPVVLFILLYKLVPSFEFMDEKMDRNESYGNERKRKLWSSM